MSKTKQLLCMVALLLACVSLRAQASTTAQLASKQLLAMVQQGGNRTKALTLIGMGADVDAKDNLGRSLAYLAIQQDDQPLLELLLDNGANIEAVDNYDDTLLHASVAWERYDIAELLLQRGAKHSLKNSLGLTAGQYAQQLQRPAEWLEALQVSEDLQPQAPQEEPEGTTSAAEKEQAKDVSSKEEILKFSRKLNKAVNHLQYGRSGDKRLAKLKELIESGAELDFSNKNISKSLKDIVIFAPMNYSHAETIEILELMLAHGADINIYQEDGLTPLMWAAIGGDMITAEFLLANNADAKLRDNYNETAYDMTTIEEFKAILEEAMDASQVKRNTATPKKKKGKNKKYKLKDLVEAVDDDDPSKLEPILAEGVDINQMYTPKREKYNKNRKTTVTYEAAVNEKFEALRFLIVNGADLNHINDYGHLLHLVVTGIAQDQGEGEAIELVELMLEHGADINIVDEMNGKTPLMEAVDFGFFPHLVRFLLERGAKVDITDRQGRTAYDIIKESTDEKDKEIEAMLKEAMDALRIKREEEAGIELYELHANAASGDMEAVRALIAAEIYLERKNDEGKVPFQVAVAAKHYSIAAVLLRAMRDINGQDEEGWTPLHFAILAQDFELMRELIRAGANPNVGHGSIGDGQTAFELAEEMGIKKELVEMLHEEGSYYTHER